MEVLAARWLIFRAFIETARELHGEALHENIRRDWLYFQILDRVRVEPYSRDPFVACIETCLKDQSTESLYAILRETGPESVLKSAFDPQVDTFYYVLDEAKAFATMNEQAFTNVDEKVPQPLLRPIVQVMCHSHGTSFIKCIISGRGPVLKHVEGISSDVATSPGWEVVHSTGHLMDQKAQEAFIARFIPNSFLSSPTGRALLVQMFQWLRGR